MCVTRLTGLGWVQIQVECDFTQSPIEIKWSDHPHRKRPRDEDGEPPVGVA